MAKGGNNLKRVPQTFDLVELIWDDAAAQEAMWTGEIKEPTPHLISSIGYLVFLNKKYAVIAQDLDCDGHHNGRTQIPRGIVKTMRVLRKKD